MLILTLFRRRPIPPPARADRGGLEPAAPVGAELRYAETGRNAVEDPRAARVAAKATPGTSSHKAWRGKGLPATARRWRLGVRFATDEASAEAAAAHIRSPGSDAELRYAAIRDAFRVMDLVAEAPAKKHRAEGSQQMRCSILGQERATGSAEGIVTRMCRDAGSPLPAARSRDRARPPEITRSRAGPPKDRCRELAVEPL